jgi:hypothetical protein
MFVRMKLVKKRGALAFVAARILRHHNVVAKGQRSERADEWRRRRDLGAEVNGGWRTAVDPHPGDHLDREVVNGVTVGWPAV